MSGPREILTEGIRIYEEGVNRGLYELDESDIRVLAQADLYRQVMMGDGGCSLQIQAEAGERLTVLIETNKYKKAESKLYTNRKF